MSQSQMVAAARHDAQEATITGDDAQAVLDALDDPDCQAILEATSDDPKSASELSDACDLPLSTAYRKIERLTDADLLAEKIRIRRSGKHVSEYARNVEDVTVSVTGDAGVELNVTHTESTRSTRLP